ncbi:hypothetical protein HUA76_36950 [Myxococcus sp. CA056]|uniref:hypothetical protein n=1 Tax=Myxococcus sp. CA056 TaxID=2741740 RepID=UPI00157B9FA3|nr:hypothetical protein [Myxococcus sp. CA056]NTX16374.1 hypothetical protein [Myxococcus sp. CA056]
MHVWLVPMVLIGAGLLLGIVICVVEEVGDGECGNSVAMGVGLGLALALGYLQVLAGDDFSTDCSDEDSSCDADEARRSRSSRKGQQPSSRPRSSLPRWLAPSVGVVNDSAVFGLGGHF